MAVIGYYILFLFLAFLIYFFPVPLRYLQQAKLQRKCSQKNIEQHPQIVEKIVAAGHEIGFHGYNHVNAWKNSLWKAIADIKLSLKSLSFFNATCSFFGAPHIGKSYSKHGGYHMNGPGVFLLALWLKPRLLLLNLLHDDA